MVAGAVIGFLASWLVAKALFDVDARFSDVPLYRAYGESMVAGSVPYRDIAIEYPPGALPFFFLPAALTSSAAGFAWVFEALLAVCGVAIVIATSATLRELGSSPLRIGGALAFVAVTPLLLGRVAFERYDLWPTALLAAGLALHARGRTCLTGVAIGLGMAAKLFPVVVLPVLVASAWRQRGRRAATECLVTSVTTFLVCTAPFFVLAPGGLAEAFTRQLRRPLQIETLGASLLMAGHHVFGLSLGIESSFGSINLGGDGPALAAGLLTVVAAAIILASWLAAGASLETVTLAAAVSVTTLVALGKVLSPQFVLWLLPVVVLVGGASGVTAIGLLATAMVLTNVLFPSLFLALMRFDEGASWTLLGRNLALVCLLVTVARALWVKYGEDAFLRAPVMGDGRIATGFPPPLPRWPGRRGAGSSRARRRWPR